ncbi:ankyrin repeat protein [Aspergillus steynii IBT 23096]|uniref:Ankyrin repeat protein n=1 Tax=Aspergillus steynii IBT 23096 TaxID=1392250 RepID=A0A2I2GF53_9EURO|nr:ankyrin repeat protein [Aspergillus steynii IBT 23096]PLB51515.1 ankyrin repeat protein [Aspergillus steynii IBT 23096]
MTKRLTHNDYLVAWICRVGIELDAAVAMLDHVHQSLEQGATDRNVYNLGDIAGHNVVIAGLAQVGNPQSASAISSMKATFPNLGSGLLVGTAGGVPTRTDQGDIRLGDIIVSKPTASHPGVVQYSQGTDGHNRVQQTRTVQPPPGGILRAVQQVNANWNMRDGPISTNRRSDNLPQDYAFPGRHRDLLFDPGYVHRQPGLSCSEGGCDLEYLTNRDPRTGEGQSGRTVAHLGTILSGDSIIQNALTRDHLAGTLGGCCFDTETIGALSELPCLVVRGIADYCDSHKHDEWQKYASATAATYAKEMLRNVSPREMTK